MIKLIKKGKRTCQEVEVSPCPLCGTEAPDAMHVVDKTWAAFCPKCGRMGAVGHDGPVDCYNKWEELVKYYNSMTLGGRVGVATVVLAEKAREAVDVLISADGEANGRGGKKISPCPCCRSEVPEPCDITHSLYRISCSNCGHGVVAETPDTCRDAWESMVERAKASGQTAKQVTIGEFKRFINRVHPDHDSKPLSVRVVNEDSGSAVLSGKVKHVDLKMLDLSPWTDDSARLVFVV